MNDFENETVFFSTSGYLPVEIPDELNPDELAKGKFAISDKSNTLIREGRLNTLLNSNGLPEDGLYIMSSKERSNTLQKAHLFKKYTQTPMDRIVSFVKEGITKNETKEARKEKPKQANKLKMGGPSPKEEKKQKPDPYTLARKIKPNPY